MRNILLSFFVGLIFLAATTAVRADEYGDIAQKILTLDPANIISAHEDVMSMPESDVRSLFLAVTVPLNSIVENDGGEINTIAELLEEYGLSMGTTLGKLQVKWSDDTNLFETSTKSINDARDFLEAWDENLTTGLDHVDPIPATFEHTITMPSGEQIQLDHTDALLIQSGLELTWGIIKLLCAHDMNASISQLSNREQAKALLDENTFLEYRSDASSYLQSSKLTFINALKLFKEMLNSYEREPATPVGQHELFDLADRKTIDEMRNVASSVRDTLDEYSLYSGTPVELGEGPFETFDLSKIFKGQLSLAKVLPTFVDTGIRFSTIGHKLGNDATLNAMFPNATQKDWNRQIFHRCNLSYPYTLLWDKAVPLTSKSGLTELGKESGSYSEQFTMDFNWETQDVRVTGIKNSSSVRLSVGNAYTEIGAAYSPLANAQKVYHKRTNGKITYLFASSTGNLEINIFKDGSISVNTDYKYPLEIFCFFNSENSFVTKSFYIDKSNPDRQNFLLSQTADDTPGIESINLVPIIQMLLN